ncbi:MAG TPA: prolipoprotein diacylglyceryl transferase family protein [Kofleriaceae bacterium]|nr:prolipoprotein diacylglyceryl transferase family protein [Kofleriaceae bacterium]
MRSHVVAWLARWFPPAVAQALAPTWFTMVGLAGLVSLWVMLRHARRDGHDPAAVATAAVAGYLAAVTAGIAVPALIQLVQDYVTDGRLHLAFAGMTSFWGYTAGALALAAVCRGGAPPLGWMVDRATPVMGVSLALVRTGCFLAGCDYGQISSVPWAVRFPRGTGAWRDHVAHGLLPATRDVSLPVHPTQLYEAALGLAIAVAAWAHNRRGRIGDGRVFLAAAATYAAARLGIENLRGDETRGVYAGLSSGQLYALAVLAAIGGAVALRARRRTMMP